MIYNRKYIKLLHYYILYYCYNASLFRVSFMFFDFVIFVIENNRNCLKTDYDLINIIHAFVLYPENCFFALVRSRIFFRPITKRFIFAIPSSRRSMTTRRDADSVAEFPEKLASSRSMRDQ